ncbi:hypothetical protein MANES_01G024500v8 [Manihot esculenta]|uniref:Uncharacterized protein n=1 Tax=Manihot esculenta TaxID=3983 RepID=A0A2C9WJG7_MANES|nr:hypothetical protein MANES_01G024500v8 [Manihot esculenta]
MIEMLRNFRFYSLSSYLKNKISSFHYFSFSTFCFSSYPPKNESKCFKDLVHYYTITHPSIQFISHSIALHFDRCSRLVALFCIVAILDFAVDAALDFSNGDALNLPINALNFAVDPTLNLLVDTTPSLAFALNLIELLSLPCDMGLSRS